MLGSPPEEPREGSRDVLGAALSEAAKTITVEQCIRSVWVDALVILKRAGFEDVYAGDDNRRQPIQREDGSLSTIFKRLCWKGSDETARELFPEFVVDRQLRLNEAVGSPLQGHPELHGASMLQIELIRGLSNPLYEAGIVSSPGFVERGDARWLCKFRSNDALVIRIPILYRNFTSNERVEAQLRFWDGFPGTALAKPV